MVDVAIIAKNQRYDIRTSSQLSILSSSSEREGASTVPPVRRCHTLRGIGSSPPPSDCPSPSSALVSCRRRNPIEMMRRLTALTAVCLMLAASISWACGCLSGTAFAGSHGHGGHSAHAGHMAHGMHGMAAPGHVPVDVDCHHDCLSCAKLDAAPAASVPALISASLFAIPAASPEAPQLGSSKSALRHWHATADPPSPATPVSLHTTLLV